ncbi:MAG: hypothetical protein ACRDL2_00355 [Gaiellaceae bacterium]|jgi:hypothetical protein
MPELWTPINEGPHEEFVSRVHRAIAKFSEAMSVETPVVEIELADTSRFILDRIEPEPGFGMITIYVQNAREKDLPDALVIPIGLIRRFELRKAPEERVARFGFSIPSDR